eukprot:1158103-Pelagomonas_calceolata.AAC.8
MALGGCPTASKWHASCVGLANSMCIRHAHRPCVSLTFSLPKGGNIKAYMYGIGQPCPCAVPP